MTKYHKIVLVVSVLGLITYFLPVIQDESIKLALSDQIVMEYLKTGWLFRIPFLIGLIIILVGSTKQIFSKLKSISLILLGIILIVMNMGLIEFLKDGNSSANISYGGILAYICAIIYTVTGILAIKNTGGISKEKLEEYKEKGISVTKSAVSVTTKIAKNAADEVKKEIDKGKK